MQPINTNLKSKQPTRFDPPPAEYDELAAYWAFVAKRLPDIKARRARK